jgi:hypothetical protein
VRVDAKRTKLARQAHERGVAALHIFFQADEASLATAGDTQNGRPRPLRMRPGVPPLRPDKQYRLKRRRRKLAHESRRRNR